MRNRQRSNAPWLLAAATVAVLVAGLLLFPPELSLRTPLPGATGTQPGTSQPRTTPRSQPGDPADRAPADQGPADQPADQKPADQPWSPPNDGEPQRSPSATAAAPGTAPPPPPDAPGTAIAPDPPPQQRETTVPAHQR